MRWWVERAGRRVEVAVRRRGDRFEVALDGRTSMVEVVPVAAGLASLLCEDGRSFALGSQRVAPGRYRISLVDREFEVVLRHPLEREVAERGVSRAGTQEVRAPIPGKVVSGAVVPGQEVAAGEALLVLEAMKMENRICTDGPGTVREVLVSPGTTVEGGQVLVTVS